MSKKRFFTEQSLWILSIFIFFVMLLAPAAAFAEGTLSVTIEPEEANDAGAAWRIAGDAAWLASGAERTDLISAYHDVEFLPVPGWDEPGQIG